MSNLFAKYVAGFERLLLGARTLGAVAAARPQLPAPAADAPVCLIFSPHPDDEAISGGLPWRLRTQCGWRVVNVAVTLGSNLARRAQRWQELVHCCDYLGFDLISASGEMTSGLERITPQTVALEPAYWADCARRVADLIDRHQPRLIVCPHDNDGHPAHIGTHLLVMDALRRTQTPSTIYLALSEYWNTQPDPGLMVELSATDVASLIAALSLHAGEVARNPYHLTLPAWFIDNVRRGAERVGSPGGTAPDFCFASLYGWQRWSGGACRPMAPRILPLSVQPDAFFG